MISATSPNIVSNNLTFPLSYHSHNQTNNHTYNYIHNNSNNIDETHLFLKNLKPIEDDFYKNVSSTPFTSFSSLFSTSSSSSKSTLVQKKKIKENQNHSTAKNHAKKQSNEKVLPISDSINNTSNKVSTEDKLFSSKNKITTKITANSFNDKNINNVNNDNINAKPNFINISNNNTNTLMPKLTTKNTNRSNVKTVRSIRRTCKRFTSLWNMWVHVCMHA